MKVGLVKTAMKCVLASAFGEIDQVLELSGDGAPRPELKPGSGKVLVRVHACSLSPSDQRTLSGEGDLFKKPEAFPYIPGGDVCGTVVQIDESPEGPEKASKFKVGDVIVGTWDIFGEGGLAEYALVMEAYAVLKPDGVNYLEAAALANSPSHAMQAVQRAGIKEGSRVLVLGGSGGMGTLIVQLARDAGASFVAATSTDERLLKSLGADQVIDYREREWSELPEFLETPLDAIIDCAEGSSAWEKATKKKVLKNGDKGGRFVAVVFHEWKIEIHRWSQIMGFLAPIFWRKAHTGWTQRSTPRYLYQLGSAKAPSMAEVNKLVEAKRLKTVLDPASPHPFTTQGIRDAFHKLEDRKGHGKIVIQVSDEIAAA